MVNKSENQASQQLITIRLALVAPWLMYCGPLGGPMAPGWEAFG